MNLGTPEAPTVAAVRAYLRQFLSDPRVLSLPAPLRHALLYGFILPFRPRISADAYRKIWTSEGSPLLVHSRALASAVARTLAGCDVRLAMRYGHPSLAHELDRAVAERVRRIVVVPLFPQSCAATTGSIAAAAFERLRTVPDPPALAVLPPFFAEPGFLDAVEGITRTALRSSRPEHVLFSYHGLPLAHVRRDAGPGAPCDGRAASTCCEPLSSANEACYRAQCLATTAQLAARLRLRSFSTSFQSRLGRSEWLGPATDVSVADLARRGVRRLAVLCPAFVADCVETLEEIGIRARATFRAHGGSDLTLVPCVNADAGWSAALAGLVQPLAGSGASKSNPQ